MINKDMIGGLNLRLTILSYILLSPIIAGCQTKSEHTDRFMLLDLSELQHTKAMIEQKEQRPYDAYLRLIESADKTLKRGPYSVMHKTGIPPSNNKHDYLSLAPYFWPNPETTDSLPWIRKDGEVNPQTRENYSDYEELSKLFGAVSILGKAFYFSDNEKYAVKAIALIDAWFLDDKTKMNPNLNYGQGIPGVNNGRPFGVIEFGGIKNVLLTLEILKYKNILDSKTENGMRNWLEAYANWLQTSELGKMEGTRDNNHGTNYDLQLCNILLYLGKKEQAVNHLETISKKRIAQQIEPDGSQPHELARTKSFSYSTMNLSAFTRLAKLAHKVDVDLWNYETEDGRSIKKAYEFLIPYLTEGKEWEHQQIRHVNIKEKIIDMLQDAGNSFHEERFLEIAAKYNKASATNKSGRETLLIAPFGKEIIY